MKKIDMNGLSLCRHQAEFFTASLTKCNLSSPIFVKTFMCSNYVKSIDRFETLDFDSFFKEIKVQRKSIKLLVFSSDELYWMGYIYRYWSFTREVSSRQIYRAISATELRKLFFSYHTQDPEKTIALIQETNPLFPKDQLSVIRSIYGRKTKKTKSIT